MLSFTAQPAGVAAGSTLPAISVSVLDSAGRLVASASPTIAIALGSNASGALLSGTTSKVASGGVATFSDLVVDRSGSFTLTAGAAGLTGATSSSFAIGPAPPYGSTPGLVVGNHSFSSLAGGLAHRCAFSSSRVTYCWGQNHAGQLGDGTSIARSAPTRTTAFRPFTTLTTGNTHTCALEMGTSVGDPGPAFCWGSNASGQVGDGTTSDRVSAVAVSGGRVYTAITAGGLHTCAIDSNGSAWCWGNGTHGQLGNGVAADQHMAVQVSGGRTFKAISAGTYHTCALTGDGSAWCWGKAQEGQLGNGFRDSRNGPVAVSGGHRFAMISSGSLHTCGVTTGGATLCWGANDFGQLGDGSEVSRAVPGPVSGTIGFTSVNAGVEVTCALTAAGRAWCWGSNDQGKLGAGSTESWITRPVEVRGAHTFAALATGGGTCGRKNDGSVWCWGRGPGLGDGQ